MNVNPPSEAVEAAPPPLDSDSPYVVGIGASAGGIAALKKFFSLMPVDSGMAFIVILHLSREHESHLAQIIQTETTMPVKQVRESTRIEPNCVYVNPPEKHMKVHEGMITLSEPEFARGRRVPIDLLFRTLGESYREKGICIVLSGTGADGTLGLKRVKESGGISLVQDPSEAEYNAMPISAIETKLVDLVLRIDEMPARLLSLMKHVESFAHIGDAPVESPREGTEEEILREILLVLRVRTGNDFSGYISAQRFRAASRAD